MKGDFSKKPVKTAPNDLAVLFQQGRVVEGLAQMTVALERAPDSDRDWIRPLQEEAFAVTDDSARQAAIERADSLLSQK